jgi:hypothetical protein
MSAQCELFRGKSAMMPLQRQACNREGATIEVVSTSIARPGFRSRNSLMTVWQRTKSPIHM